MDRRRPLRRGRGRRRGDGSRASRRFRLAIATRRCSVDLRRGKVLARVGSAGALSIHARDTRTTSEGPARFVVLADENGRVAVATIAGTTRFAAGGKTVALPAGTASASKGGSPPEDPEHISEDVFLNVAWPTVDRHGEHAEIKGRASPSSVVTVRAPS